MKNVAIIGAGPAGLMAADILSRDGVHVIVFDQKPSPARKFLLAGRGGLNLTHSEPFETFMTRYGSAESHLRAAIAAFTPDNLRNFAHELGQDTFIGSSGRIFPKAFKASPLLRAWLRRLASSGVEFRPRHHWIGWNREGDLSFATVEGDVSLQHDATILALGGASWPHLGSDGAWTTILAQRGVDIAPLRPANSGFTVSWSERFRTFHAGQPLKGLALSFGGKTVRGEAMLTAGGIEGGGIYALSSALREAIAADGTARLRIALRPDLSQADLQRRLDAPRGKRSLSNHLRRTLHLSPTEIALLHEVSSARLGERSSAEIAALVNNVEISLTGTTLMARAISSAGGVRFESVNDDFMLKQLPGVFVAGEMLDWEAPTGGYLLQATFATGAAAGRGALRWLNQRVV
jgi:uncharacterized flavoprotein (TIGR03862 family)